MPCRTLRPVRLFLATLLFSLCSSVLVEAGWAHSDVGAVTVKGKATIKNGRFTVSGEGTSLESTADSFHFLYQPLAADGTMVVRMASLQNTNAWARGGVMFRQALTAGSIHAALLVTPSNGVLFQRRTADGGETGSTASAGTTPRWLRITRTGATISASTSTDGLTWTSAGTASVPFTGAIYAGLAVSSYRPGRLATAAFDSVELLAASQGTGLVAAWSFDEGRGTVASDQLGTSNGTISGATWTSGGRFGNALIFDGTSSTVSVKDNAALDLSGAMTLEAWMRPASLSSWRNVLTKERVDGVAYALYANADVAVPAGSVTTSTVEGQVPATAPLPLNTWSHVAVSYDGSALRLYVNGLLAGSKGLTGALLQTTGALRIGGNSVWGEYFHGTIDNVRIYNRALSAAEIQSAMKTPVVPAKPPADSTPPTVSITSPAPASTLSGVVTVAAKASDDVGVKSVQLLANGAALGPALTTAPYAVAWDTTAVANDTYVFTAVALDAAGNSTVSPAVTVTVNNAATGSNPRVLEFTSPDHNTLLPDGQPAVTGYTLEVWQAGTNPASSGPYRSTQIGKPSSTTTLVRTDQQAFLCALPKGQQYFTTVLVDGPGGSARSSASNSFVVY